MPPWTLWLTPENLAILNVVLLVWAVTATLWAVSRHRSAAEWKTLALDTVAKVEAATDASRVWERRWRREWRSVAENERIRQNAPTTEPGQHLWNAEKTEEGRLRLVRAVEEEGANNV